MLRTFRNGILEAVPWDDKVRRLLAACLSIIVASFWCVVKDYVCCALHCNPSPEPEALQRLKPEIGTSKNTKLLDPQIMNYEPQPLNIHILNPTAQGRKDSFGFLCDPYSWCG